MTRLLALSAITMLAFAANSILNRIALTTGAADPAAFAAVRTASGAVVLIGLTLMKTGFPRLRRPGRLTGTLSLTVYMLGFSFAYVSLDAGLGALVLFGVVQITMFSAAVFRAEAVPRARWIGASVAFAGLAWLVWPTGAVAPSPVFVGLMVIAAIGWGIYSLVGRSAADPLAETAANFLCAAPIVLVAWALAGGGITGAGVLIAVLAGAVTSGLGYTLWYAVLPQLDRSVAAITQLTVPVIALVAGAIILNEAITWPLVLASAIVLGGVAFGALAPGQRKIGSKGS